MNRIVIGTLCLMWLHGSTSASDLFSNSTLPFLEKYCFTCHSTEKQQGELDLEQFNSDSFAKKHPDTWERVLEQLDNGEMPPKDAPQLSTEDRKRLIDSVRSMLDEVALANAGDPGPVVLRRLANSEYTYSIRDLTGIDSLDPAREFPVDGAAGEGFTNAGAGLVMSPTLLTKYFDAAKEVASHAVLVPDGVRFSPSSFSRDWTDEALAKIRTLYQKYSTVRESEVEVSGAKDTKSSAGMLPLKEYLDALQGISKRGTLSEKYFAILQKALTDSKPSLLLDPLRAKFQSKQLSEADIEPWQKVLWRYANVGHIGKANGPKAWLEPVTPLVSTHEMRLKLKEDNDVTLYLVSSDAGDGNEHDSVVWENPRLVAAGRADLSIVELPSLINHLKERRQEVRESAEQYLDAITNGKDVLDSELMSDWRTYLGLGSTELTPLLTKKMERTLDYKFIQGWTGTQAFNVIANSSDATVRVPGKMLAHSIAAHPSPTHSVVVAWKSPVAGLLKISGDVVDAQSECGNGVAWQLEVRRGNTREKLAGGISQGAKLIPFGPFENVHAEIGDVVAMSINPKDGNHACDLTTINLNIHNGVKEWDLAKDVSPNILAGNPNGAWHFLSQPTTLDSTSTLPAPVMDWRKSPSSENAAKIKQHLEADFPLNSPLLRHAMRSFQTAGSDNRMVAEAPSVIEINVPAELAKDSEFVVTGRLASTSAGSVQMQVVTQKPELHQGIQPGNAATYLTNGAWSDNRLRTQYSTPIIVNDNSESRRRIEASFNEFRELFPLALCYTKIVPVDEVVTLQLFYREDDHLQRLMLDDHETAELDKLWDELVTVSEAPLKQVDVFDQLYQYATQDAKPSAFEPLRKPFADAAEAFRAKLVEVEPTQVQAIIEFSNIAWRRPLSNEEKEELQTLYQTLRQQELSHEVAVRLLLSRLFVAPAFLYRGERAGEGALATPIDDFELATRLSYFLWSSVPDDELRRNASARRLHDPAVLISQTRRMLKDPKVRRLATEFGCQWLHVRDLETSDEKSERHFPSFLALRSAMQEEVVRFFVDMFQEDRSILSLLDADHSFVNEALAKHYGMEFSGQDWQRQEGFRSLGRGGILGFSATLAKQSGASRTSPILRGNWLSEVVLGERLPRPPEDVPTLSEETPVGLTERQLIELHSSDSRCARCHERIDPFGFALEGFDAIGRARSHDAAGHPINTKTKLPNGDEIDGLKGLRDYLIEKRRDDFVSQFCRKLLGYALGRSVQLSDRPFLDEMKNELHAKDYRVGVAIELIVRSPQFLNVRGRDF